MTPMKMAIAEINIRDTQLWFVFDSHEIFSPDTKFLVMDSVEKAVRYCEDNNFEFFVIYKEDGV